jgi:hypothetical protein
LFYDQQILAELAGLVQDGLGAKQNGLRCNGCQATKD